MKKGLDSEIRSEDRWRMDGWEVGEGDDTLFPLSFLFGGVANWKWDRDVGETSLAFSCLSLVSKL